MTPKLTLSIATFVGLIFSLGMFFAPEFVTKEQFPNSEGQGFEDLVTLRYALASVIFALATITFHLRNIEGLEFQKLVMRGYTIAFSVVFFTNLVLHISGKIYAIPPIVRLTNLGIREVDKECLEAVDSFGATNWQRLTRVQMPLALPTIFAGVNQTIMMALAMVVIASMIGVKGLGVPVLRAVSNQYLALGMLNGLAIVALAIIFDRVSQQYGKRLQKHREGRNL